jgi:cell division protein FtsB
MGVISQLRGRAGQIIGPILGISLVCYFAYHLVQGDRGLIAMMGLMQQVHAAEAEKATLDAEREPLANRVKLLESAHIDRDLLDERARAVLNLAGPDEIVIYTPVSKP